MTIEISHCNIVRVHSRFYIKLNKLNRLFVSPHVSDKLNVSTQNLNWKHALMNSINIQSIGFDKWDCINLDCIYFALYFRCYVCNVNSVNV